MTALIVIGIVLLILILIAFIRVGVLAVYNAEGLLIKLVVGPVKIKFLSNNKRFDKRHAKEEHKDSAEKKGSLKQFKELFPPILEAAKRFKQKIRIDKLYLHYTAAGVHDPAKAAIEFGASNAAIGIILPLLENNFDIRKRNLVTDIDFMAEEAEIYIEAELTLAIWCIIYIAVGFLSSYLKIKKQKKEEKAV